MATKEKSAGDFAEGVSRLSAEQFDKLEAIVMAERKHRGSGKAPGSMTENEFQKFMSEQFRNADRAAREADLRDQLGGNKPKSRDTKSKVKESKYD